jgi:hypothetical protein
MQRNIIIRRQRVREYHGFLDNRAEFERIPCQRFFTSEIFQANNQVDR